MFEAFSTFSMRTYVVASLPKCFQAVSRACKNRKLQISVDSTKRKTFHCL